MTGRLCGGLAHTGRRPDIRGHGCRDLPVYCNSIWCNHSAKLTLDWLPNDTPLLDLDHRMVCTACGLVGADVRPDWTPMTGSAGMDRLVHAAREAVSEHGARHLT